MSSSSARAFPPAAALAIIGGVAGLVSLWMPWFTLDPAAVLELAKAMHLDAAIAQLQSVPADQVHDTMVRQLSGVESISDDRLVGYRLFTPVTVGLQLIAGCGALWAGLRMAGGEAPSAVTGPLFGGAAVLAGRAIYGILQVPGSNDLPLANTSIELLQPATGLWVCLGAAVVLLLAAFAATMHGSRTTSNEWIAPTGGMPGSAHVPTGMTSGSGADTLMSPGYAASGAPAYGAAPAPAAHTPPAYAPPPVPTPHAGTYVPQAAAYEPGLAYGADGPSSLDGARNAPRAADPYAPKRAIAPEAMPPAPPTVVPHHAPVAPLRTAPVEPQQPGGAPRRSVAPPGMG